MLRRAAGNISHAVGIGSFNRTPYGLFVHYPPFLLSAVLATDLRINNCRVY